MLRSPTGPLHIAAAALCLVATIAAIATAWGYQLIAGAEPCQLCYAERVPYYIGIPLLAIALLAATGKRSPLIVRGALILFALLMLYGLGLSVYHVGVEWEWWQGPTSCSGPTSSGPASAVDLLSQMQATKVVSCKEVTVRIFGMSLAFWNGVATLGFAVAGLFAGLTARRTLSI